MAATAKKEPRHPAGSATDTVSKVCGRMTPGKGESAEDFAMRLYDMQMEIYSAYSMSDLWTPFAGLSTKIQKQWVASAKKQMAEHRAKVKKRAARMRWRKANG